METPDTPTSKNSQPEELATFSTRSSKMPKAPQFNPRPKPRLKSLAMVLLVPLLSAALGFAGGWAGAKYYTDDSSRTNTTAAQQKYISSEGELIANIANTVGQGVVSIEVESQVVVPSFFGGSRSSSQASAGTGFIVSNDGVIVTNRHVVDKDATKVSVTLADGTSYENVKIIGRTSEASSIDAAFLKIEDLKGKKLNPVTLGDSTKVKVGDRVVAIGNALGQFQNSVTSGIISGYGRDVTAGDAGSGGSQALVDLLQTDAAINQGNSGGPLVNTNSEVIGINTAVAGDAQNIGFAIPINDVKGLIDSVLKSGKVEQAYLGVRYVTLTDDLAYELNLKVKRGAYIAPPDAGQPSILPGSPAEKAGLREKDIITKVNGIALDDKTSLTSALNRFKVGDKVKLTIIRGDQTLSVDATLETLPAS